ncbi:MULTISPECIES: ATP-binding protein [unclassified Halobacteriovorax]|uniref:ATP-binding protein n=1 Tax=unclassified Halobacteriovorax TaxID=2639665 RepID=UPI003999AC02
MNVSNKAVHAYINYIVENNDDPKVFFENLGHDYDIISDEKKYMTWNDYRLITEALNDKYEKFYEAMTKHGLTNKYVKRVLDILSRMISFRFVGDFILKYSFKTFYTDAVKIELIETGKTTFDIKLTFDRPEDIFPVFVDMYRIVFLALPKLVSDSMSWDVEISQDKNILIYHVNEHMGAPSIFASLQIVILRLFKLDKYYKNLIIENLQHTNDLEKKNLELETAERKIREAHKEVLLANRIISHDIANKMLIVEHVKRLIARGEIEKASQKLDIYYKSVKGIIENTRNVVDDNSSSFLMTDVVVWDLLEELIFEYQDQSVAKNIKLRIESEIDKSFTIRTNKEAFKDSILGNILQNAIKFSPEDSEVCFRIEMTDNEFFLSCKDSGIGIDSGLVNEINRNEDKLFKSTLGTHGEQGRGLGLFIIRKVCRELGLNVRFVSELGRGTKVIISKEVA